MIEPVTTSSKTPLVSVGVPTYNRVSSLSRTIASVLAQSYENLELVISDNASTDDTESLCREAERNDNRIRYFRQLVNQGPTENFKTVLRHSTGEFYMWLSDDDWLEPGYVSSCVRVLMANPDYSCVCGHVRYVSGDSIVFEERPMPLPQESPVDRVLAYFNTVERNGVFYSVMRRSDLAPVRFDNVWANDWLVMGAMAAIGKIQIAGDASLNRSCGGMGSNLQTLLEGLRLPRSTEGAIWRRLALRVFSEIVWSNRAYRLLNVRNRFWLGIRVADSILRNKWSWRYRMLRERVARITRCLAARRSTA